VSDPNELDYSDQQADEQNARADFLAGKPYAAPNTVFAKFIDCDGCREAYLREESPYPKYGDFCEQCVLKCDRCETELSERDMTRIEPGVVACEDCVGHYVTDRQRRARDNALDQHEAAGKERYLGIGR
jgi:hypothetical protein